MAAVRAADWYVATNGSDANTGTLAAPFATLMHAQAAASEGDTIYIRGGTYTSFTIFATDANYNYVHRFNKNNIHWSAYPGETPLFDFSAVPTNLRVCGFHVTGSGLVIRGFHVTGVKDGAQRQSECFRIDGLGAYVDFYDCAAYNNAANGFYWTNRSRGSATRCDAYNNIGTNADSIGNTDGFGAHGDGVVFRYCRAWNNSDDGFDCISSPGVNVFDHCWSFNHRLGGNKAGFKIGGFGADPNTVPPTPLPTHIVTYCVSAFNGAQGFYANHHPGQAATWTKNTAFNNSSGNYNMLERTADMAMDIPGVLEVLHYNIAFMGTAITQANLPPENVTENSWTKPGVTVNAADFLNTDWTQLAAPRSAGNNMPFVAFMHLAPGSDLVGLGAFDPPPAAPTGLAAAWIAAGRVDLSWDEVPGATTYYVKRATTPGGPYTTIAARLTDTAYSDTAATGATSYHYVVTAMDDISYDESAPSNEAPAIQGPTSFIALIAPDTGRSDSDGVTSSPTLVIAGGTGDTTGASAAFSAVSIFRSGAGLVGSVAAGADGSWQFDYTGTVLADGEYSFIALASNNGHDGVESPAFVVIVDTAAPAAPVIASAIGSPLVFTGTGEPDGIVTITRDGTAVVGTALVDSGGHWNCVSSTSLSEGIAVFTATVTDTAGNESQPSAELSFDSSIDAPEITHLTPDNGVSNSDNITNSPGIVLHGTSTPGAEVHVLRRGEGLAGSTTADGSGAWSVDYSATVLPDGPQVFNAIVLSDGSSSLFSDDFTAVIDTVAPEIDMIVRQAPSFPTITPSVLSVTFRVTFDSPVFNLGTGTFALATTGDASGSISGVTPVSASVFDVSVNTLAGFGEIGLEPAAGIIDLAGNALAPGFVGGQAYTLALVSLGSGVWIRPATGGLWSDEANWQDLVIADGASNGANFNSLNITANNTVSLDSSRTLNSLAFGDTVTSSAASWTVDDGGNAANTLTLAGANPLITVNTLGTNATTTINASLAGTAGLAKSGPGVLNLTKANSLTGGLTLQAGIVRLPAGGSLALDAHSSISGLGALQVTGGSFTTNSTAMLSGATISQSGGSVAIDGGLTATGNGDVFITLSGGVFTADGINIQRSSDGSINYARGLVVTGGAATLGSMQLGSVNSNGLASVEGGTLNVLGSVTIGNQTTSGRGGAFRITSGSFSVGDTTEGMVLSKVNGTNANNVSQANFLGGTSTVGKITLGYDANMTAGSGTVTINGGTLYVGSGGIVKNGAPTMTTTVTFTAGTLGASGDWSTTHPIVFSGGGAKTVRAANAAGDPFDVTLGGVLSSTGPLTKTGGGTLTLAANNTRTGVTTINDGVLSVGTIGNGGVASNLGQAALAATNLVINGGTLRYTGGGESTNRLFSVGTAGATIDASGTGALNFSSVTTLTISGAGSRTLTLAGSSGHANTMNPPIPNPSSGTTSLVKTGTGSWTLPGTKAFTGSVVIDGGTLNVTGTLAAGGSVAVNDTGTLAGTGTVNKPIVLNSGGTVSPAGTGIGTLTGPSLTWNGGGTLQFNVTASTDLLALGGALGKGDAGIHGVAFESPSPIPGQFYTLATYASTDLASEDLMITSLDGFLGHLIVEPTQLRFVSAADGPGAVYDLWTYLIGLAADQRGFDANPSGDGTSNGLKFYLAQDPFTAAPQGIVATTAQVDGVVYPAISFTRREDVGGVVGTVLVAPNLAFATDLGSVEVSAESQGDGTELVVVRSLASLAAQPNQFFKVVATLPEE